MAVSIARVLPSHRLSLKDRLSRLTFLEACKLLGPDGPRLIQTSANKWEIKIPDDVHLGADLFRLRFPEKTEDGSPIVVTVTLLLEPAASPACAGRPVPGPLLSD